MTTYSAVANKMGLENVNPDRAKVLRLTDKVERFDEASASGGVLGRFPGSEAILMLNKFRQAVTKLM